MSEKKIPTFADIGLQAKQVLYGKSNIGVFQYDQKITVNTKSAEGVIFTSKAIKAGESLTTDLKLSYTKPVGKNVVTVDWQPALKQVNCSVANTLIDGFKLTLNAQAPNTANKLKLTADYGQPYITAKASAELKKQPVFDLSAVTGYNGFLFGGAALVDPTNDQLIDNAKLAAAYVGQDFVATAHTDAAFKTVTGTYWQQLDAASSIAAEVAYEIGSESKQAKLAMAYAHVSYTGTLYKVKIGSDGMLHMHMESKLRPDTTTALSACVNSLDVNAEPKIGFAIDHSP